MFKKLLQFEIFYQFKQRAFPIFAILFMALGVFVGRQGFAPKGVNFNAVYQVYFYVSLFTLGSVFIIMFFAVSAMLRDRQYHMEGLIFSSAIKKSDYFWSRFLGTFVFSVLAFSPFLLGYIIGIYSSDLDPERLGEFQLLTYLQPWIYIAVPNIFICSTIVFSVSTLTKNSTATYVSAVFVYMLYFVSSIFLNSPLLAQAVPASPESMAIAAVADPFGIAAFFEQTQYWTPYQKNTQLLSFSGLFLLNRLVWILISVGILFTTYKILSFRKVTGKVKKDKKVNTNKTPLLLYKPLPTINSFKGQRAAFFSLLKLELKSVFKSLQFIVVLVMWLFIVFSELYSTVISGGEYGVSIYPFTNQLIDLIIAPLTLFSLILIVFYSAEIVWKERHLNFNLIVDATPVKNWVFFLSKFGALSMLPLILITIGIAMCIAFQVALGYSNFELGLYASLYYYYGLQLIVFSMIALFVNSLAKTKYLGMGIFGLVAIISLKADMLGLEHPLTSLGFMPRVSYSNMNGFYDGPKIFNHLAMYWLAFGLIFIMLSFKVWNRGVVASFSVKLKQLLFNWSTTQKISASVLVALFIGFASLIYYNTNIVSEYMTISETLDFKENYERKFKKYESLERPTRTSIKTEVAIFPKKRTYTVKATQILKNNGDKPLAEIFITERVPLENVSIENARLSNHDAFYGIHLFQFDIPLQPKDSVMFTYELKKEIKGYEEDNSIIDNGTYINRFSNFEPSLGYNSGIEISTKVEREKRNLPERIEEDQSDHHMVVENFKFEKVRFETIISTDSDQTAISSGRLIREWSENNRNYFHYKSTNKIMPAAGYLSANYTTRKTNYKGISIEQYYDKGHDFNIEKIENSVKKTLDYCQENFGAYIFDHVRIAEVPSHWPFGGFAHPGVISMTEDRLYLSDVRSEDTFDLVAKRTIHEVAHQWWGHTLSAKPVPGGSLFIEGFAKYTEAVVMEKMYGKRAIYTLNENARRRYFSGRSFEGDIEPPVYKIFGHGYISYGKALTVMLALRDLIGEHKVNKILKKITDTYKVNNRLEATTIDLLNEIYKVTTVEQQELIDDWFKRVIIYDLGIEESSYKELPNGTYEVLVKIKGERFEMLASGETKEIQMNEPIKMGVFTIHPSKVKDDSSMLHYESHTIKNGLKEFKIIVKDKPKYIAIDPYGTRSDENFQDNVVHLSKT
jgi:hypothetical protein